MSEQQTESGPAAGNIGQFAEQIAKMNKELYATDCAIIDAIEKHVKPLKDERKKLLREVKASTGINIGVLSMFYDFEAFVRDANAMEDQDEGQGLVDMCRLAAQGLKEGGVVNFLDLLDAEAEIKSSIPFQGKGNGVDPSDPHYTAGHAVGMAGGDRDDHGLKAKAAIASWQAGWDAAKAERSGEGPSA